MSDSTPSSIDGSVERSTWGTPAGHVLRANELNVSPMGERLNQLNSCPDCHGTLVCHKCQGKGSPNSNRCRCGERGDCATCRDHVVTIQKFIGEISTGSFGVAEAVLARGLNEVGEGEQSSKTLHSIGGAGIGAMVGTLLFPGVGTIIGGLFGKAVGEGSTASCDWMRADLYFALGFLYSATNRKAEANQAWIKALTLKEDHEPSRYALSR